MALSRRAFIKSTFASSLLMSLAPTVPMFLTRAALAGTGRKRRDTVLVVVQLSGGNDGLNTLVPYADDAYGRARKTLRLTGRDVIKVDDYLGFHPEMPGFARLLKEGQLSVVQGVGYPNSDRGHDGAMRNWHTASPDQPQCPTGWVGRAIDGASRANEPDLPGMFVGPIKQPFALAAHEAVVPSIGSTRQFTLDTMPGPAGAAHRRLLLEADKRPADDDNPLADYLRRSALTAHATSQHVEVVLADAARPGAYPSFGLAQHLQTVAELIRADVGIRIFFVELGGGGIGGFDNHANQKGNHDAMLEQLSASVAAFVDDMAHHRCLDRVTLMTFSEFGRTLTENGRRGTGHGAAQPIFLAGGARLRPGLIGKHPSLTDLDNDAPKHHTDFRSVYASALEDWLGLDSNQALGAKFKPTNLFAG